ncbi:MAG: hypothetical protein ACHQ4G_04905 [Opitutales bacterium]
MLVLDESWVLWPSSARSERSTPKHVDWLRTALVDFGVPVALISTPQWWERACDRFTKGGWNANQLLRRLARSVELPDSLSADDAVRVARSYFPNAQVSQLKRIAGMALLTIGYLSTIAHLRKRVDFFSRREPDQTEAELITKALAEIAPSLAASADAKPVAKVASATGNSFARVKHESRATTAIPPDRAGFQPLRLSSNIREPAASATV